MARNLTLNRTSFRPLQARCGLRGRYACRMCSRDMAPAAPPGKPRCRLLALESCRQHDVHFRHRCRQHVALYLSTGTAANNTWACRGAPPAPWTFSHNLSLHMHMNRLNHLDHLTTSITRNKACYTKHLIYLMIFLFVAVCIWICWFLFNS